MSKDLEAIRALYNARIAILEARENQILAAMAPDAAKSMRELLDLTGHDEQNIQLEEAIRKIETLISTEYVEQYGDGAEKLQQQIAQEILALDKELQVFGASGEMNGLESLAKGEYSKLISPSSSGVTLVSNSDLNDWLVKIMKRIAAIKAGDKKKFTGYLSNLKGEYLEQAVLAQLKKYLPKDAVTQGGTMRVGTKGGKGRQIEEDIFLVYDDGAQVALNEALTNGSYKTKSGRISIQVPLYEQIQAGAAGISIKAGSAPIKFYEGNLDLFFAAQAGDIDVDNYRNNVLRRSITGHKDNEKGALMNRYITALRLDKAVGSNNVFLATRNKMLTTMSKELELLRDNGMLSMYYNIKTQTATKTKSGTNVMSTITGRIVAPLH